MRGAARALLCAALLLPPAACERDGARQVVNVYSWPGYVAADTIAGFEARTGIRVNYSLLDTNQVLETKLLAGHSGYDVVVPGAGYLQRLARAGALRKLAKSQVPNLRNLDPAVMAAVRRQDPGNAYGVPYVWGTNGFAYDREMILARMPDAPLDSWDMLFKPEVVARFADCGVVFYDTPIAVVPHVLAWLGRDPNSESLDDLVLAERALLAVRPYIRYLSNVRQFADLASGAVCLAFSDNGNALQARARRREAARGRSVTRCRARARSSGSTCSRYRPTRRTPATPTASSTTCSSRGSRRPSPKPPALRRPTWRRAPCCRRRCATIRSSIRRPRRGRASFRTP